MMGRLGQRLKEMDGDEVERREGALQNLGSEQPTH